MKKIILLLPFFCFIFSYSQQKSFNIQWEGSKTLSTSASKIEIPSFNNENFSFDRENGLKFVAQWKINGLINDAVKAMISQYPPAPKKK